MDPAVEAVLNVDVTKIEYGAALGQGAFGQVRAATYQGERVAVKAQDVDKDGEDFTYLVREMQIMVVVKHPNVLRLVGAGKEPLGGNRERYLLLMEICELGDLRKLWTRRFQAHRPLSWFQVTFILLGAARGIERLHSSGILHRDIKTENLLVHRGMVCKVADFGMSRQEAISEPAQMDNKHMTLCGTDEFMAPEVLFEEPYNFQADSFSFGVVLAEVVCRTVPGRSTGFLQRSPRTQFNVDFEDLEKRMAMIKDPEAPMQLRELCKECLAYDMDERACSDDIADWLQGVFEDLHEDGGEEAELHEDDAPDAPVGANSQDPAHATGAHDQSNDPPPAFEMSDAGDTDVEDSDDESRGADRDAAGILPVSDHGDTESIGEPSGDAESDSDVPPPPPASDGEQDGEACEELLGDDEPIYTIDAPSNSQTKEQVPSSLASSSASQDRATQPPPLPHIPATATSRRSGSSDLLPLGSGSCPPSNPSPRPGSWRSVQSQSGGDRFARLVNQKAAKSRAAIKRTVENVVAPEDRQEQDMVLRDVESMTASLEAMQRYLRPVDEDDSDLPVVPLHGFMAKKSKFVKVWKKWFFVLRRGRLIYYETLQHACQNKRQRGSIDLVRAEVAIREKSPNEASLPAAMNIFPLKGKAKCITIGCESLDEVLLWKQILDNEIAALVSPVVATQLKNALRNGPHSANARNDQAFENAQREVFSSSLSPRTSPKKGTNGGGAAVPSPTKSADNVSTASRRLMIKGIIAEQKVYVASLSFLRTYYIVPLWDELRRVLSNSSKSFTVRTAQTLAQILPRPATVESIEAVHNEIVQHFERVLLGWPAIPIAPGLLSTLPYLRVYKSYAAQVTPATMNQIEQLGRRDVGWSNLLEFLFHSAHWNLRCPLDILTYKPANAGKVLTFAGLLSFPCTRILALQNSLRDLALAFRSVSDAPPQATVEVRQERQGLCRCIVLLKQMNRDVKKTSVDMASQRNLLRLKKTISSLAYHSLEDVPGHALRRSDTLLCEVGKNSGMKMKLQVVLVNNALLLFKFVDTAYVPPAGETPPTELLLKIPLSTANLTFQPVQNGLGVKVQDQLMAQLYMPAALRTAWLQTVNQLTRGFRKEV